MANLGERSQVCRNLDNDDGPLPPSLSPDPPTHSHYSQVENENSGVLGVDDPRSTEVREVHTTFIQTIELN